MGIQSSMNHIQPQRNLTHRDSIHTKERENRSITYFGDVFASIRAGVQFLVGPLPVVVDDSLEEFAAANHPLRRPCHGERRPEVP